MPPQERAFLLQTAVMWPFTNWGPDGEPQVGNPVELCPPQCGVRWLTKRRTVVDGQGNTIALDATVTTSRFVPMNSWMWLGCLYEWSGTGSGVVAFPDQELMIVKYYNQTPDIKRRHSLHELGLMRLTNKPT